MSESVSQKARKGRAREEGEETLVPSVESPSAGPCIGLPVQYHTGQEIVPGVLQRPSRVDPELWDVKISLSGAGTLVTRSGVRYSPEPRAGYWSHLPI